MRSDLFVYLLRWQYVPLQTLSQNYRLIDNSSYSNEVYIYNLYRVCKVYNYKEGRKMSNYPRINPKTASNTTSPELYQKLPFLAYKVYYSTIQ